MLARCFSLGHYCKLILLILTPVAGGGIQQDESCMDLVFVQIIDFWDTIWDIKEENRL